MARGRGGFGSGPEDDDNVVPLQADSAAIHATGATEHGAGPEPAFVGTPDDPNGFKAALKENPHVLDVESILASGGSLSEAMRKQDEALLAERGVSSHDPLATDHVAPAPTLDAADEETLAAATSPADEVKVRDPLQVEDPGDDWSRDLVLRTVSATQAGREAHAEHLRELLTRQATIQAKAASAEAISAQSAAEAKERELRLAEVAQAQQMAGGGGGGGRGGMSLNLGLGRALGGIQQSTIKAARGAYDLGAKLGRNSALSRLDKEVRHAQNVQRIVFEGGVDELVTNVHAVGKSRLELSNSVTALNSKLVAHPEGQQFLSNIEATAAEQYGASDAASISKVRDGIHNPHDTRPGIVALREQAAALSASPELAPELGAVNSNYGELNKHLSRVGGQLETLDKNGIQMPGMDELADKLGEMDVENPLLAPPGSKLDKIRETLKDTVAKLAELARKIAERVMSMLGLKK